MVVTEDIKNVISCIKESIIDGYIFEPLDDITLNKIDGYILYFFDNSNNSQLLRYIRIERMDFLQWRLTDFKDRYKFTTLSIIPDYNNCILIYTDVVKDFGEEYGLV